MPILNREDVKKFLRYTETQLEDERILYESKITNAVREIADNKLCALSDLQSDFYTQQWMLVNLPQLQSEKTAMQIHHEKIMIDKFEYYNRTNNMDGLNIWIGSLLKNIGFTEYEVDRFLVLVSKIGQKLYNKVNVSEKL